MHIHSPNSLSSTTSSGSNNPPSRASPLQGSDSLPYCQPPISALAGRPNHSGEYAVQNPSFTFIRQIPVHEVPDTLQNGNHHTHTIDVLPFGSHPLPLAQPRLQNGLNNRLAPQPVHDFHAHTRMSQYSYAPTGYDPSMYNPDAQSQLPSHIPPYPPGTIDPRATTADASVRHPSLAERQAGRPAPVYTTSATYPVGPSSTATIASPYPAGPHRHGAASIYRHSVHAQASDASNVSQHSRRDGPTSSAYPGTSQQLPVYSNGRPTGYSHPSIVQTLPTQTGGSPLYDERMPPPPHPASHSSKLRVDPSPPQNGSNTANTVSPTSSVSPQIRRLQPPDSPVVAKRNPRLRPGGNKRPRPSSDVSEDELDSDEDDRQTDRGPKLHKACSNCRKQKSKCVKKETEERCRMCKAKGLECVFEQRTARKQPIQRGVLLEELKKKDAVIESLRQMLKPHMLTLYSASEDPSSSSPPSNSATTEEPVRRQVLEWLANAEQSRNIGLNFDSKTYDSSDGESESRTSIPAHARVHGRSLSLNTARANKHRSPTRSLRRITLPMDCHPVGLLAKSSFRGSRGRLSAAGSNVDLTSPVEIGVARQDYFTSSSAARSSKLAELGLRTIEMDAGLSEEPKLLRKGLIVPDEVDKLFKIFFEKLNVTVNILDPALHTPTTTFARCPLLFTVVCAVSSRFYTARKELYSIAMHFAMQSASAALVDSKKSVELCQAFILLSIWSLPSLKHEEDRTWLYLGLAIRMAMDLNLHLPSMFEPTTAEQEREVLNRTRTWMLCYNLDRSTAAQLGKPMTIRDNYTIRHGGNWYKSSKFGVNSPFDIHLVGLTQLLGILSEFLNSVYSDLDHPTGLREDLDLKTAALEMDDRVMKWAKDEATLFKQDSSSNDPASSFRKALLPFYVNYCRLVILSFGFQYAIRNGLVATSDDQLVSRCFEAASGVIVTLVERMAPTEYLKYSPDGYMGFPAFAAAFLLKLHRPKFQVLLTPAQADSIIPLLERLISTLNDHEVAVDEMHGPKVYGRFLNTLLVGHRDEVAQSNSRQTPAVDIEVIAPLSTSALNSDDPDEKEATAYSTYGLESGYLPHGAGSYFTDNALETIVGTMPLHPSLIQHDASHQMHTAEATSIMDNFQADDSLMTRIHAMDGDFATMFYYDPSIWTPGNTYSQARSGATPGCSSSFANGDDN